VCQRQPATAARVAVTHQHNYIGTEHVPKNASGTGQLGHHLSLLSYTPVRRQPPT
jgi:hypothetical protein